MRPLALVWSLPWLCLAQATTAQPAPSAPRILRAARIPDDRITLDASANEPEWSSVPRDGDFSAREPHEGLPSDPTFVSVVYDDQAIYVLVELKDSVPDRIQGRLTRRDEPSTSDWVSLYLANASNRRLAYRFSVNAAGVKQDARILDGTNEDLAYDALWDACVRRHASGWTVEYRVPFHQLNYGGLPAFRIQVIRYQSRTGEQSTLFPFPKASADLVRYLGRLEGIERLPNPIRLEVAPYASLSWNNDPWTLSPHPNVGGDFKLTLSPEIVLNGTILPDFRQVEADPSELNLTVYETYFPERRPFFLDGMEAFDFGLRAGITTDRLFYTRRIGQPPRVDPGVDTDQVIYYPRSTDILAATKLVARTHQGYTVGVLHALTGESYATIRDPDAPRRVQVAPVTEYFLARVDRDFASGRTHTGAMVTTVNRDLGPNLHDSLAKNATTAGFDVEHRTSDLKVTGKAFFSHSQGSPAAISAIQKSSVHYFQRPDQHHARLDPRRTSLDGWGLTVVGSKFSGAPLRASWGGTILSPGFDPNDLGYLQRADEINGFVYVQYLQTRPTRHYRSYFLDANVWSNFTFGGESTGRAVVLSGTWILPDTSSAKVIIERDDQRLDPRVLRGGPAMRIPGRNLLTVSASTDDRRPVAVDVATWGGRHDRGVSYWVGANANLRIRPYAFVHFALSPSYQHAFDGFSYVDQPEGANVIVSRMQRDTLSLTLRASIAVTPTLSLQLYCMPYLSVGTRYGFSEVIAAQSERFENHFRPTTYDGDRNVWFAQTRTNAVLRWEYSPGSTAFLVWAREQLAERSDRGAAKLDRDIDSLLSASAADTILFKWSHRFSY